ncbi:MAG: RND transporter, partial [Polaromonas sp.]
MKRLFSSAPALSLLFAALLLAGCATSTPLDMSSVPATPAAFREQAASVAVATPASGEAVEQGVWWGVFADPVLNQLVEQASRNNNSVQVAAGRLV